MENRGGAKPGIRCGFSWADEVEREEREQQQLEEQQQQRWETEREQQQNKAGPFSAARPREVEQRRWKTEREQQIQTKADPFGAARPREVVLAEKGVDWRARDRELDLHLRTAPRPRPRPRHAHNHAATTSKGAVVAAHGATPARGAPCGNRDAGRTPHPRGRRAAASTPPLPLPPTVSQSAWGGSKRKCAGEVPGPSRRVRQVDDQRRKVFGELNVVEACCGSSIRASNNNKGCDSGGCEAQGIKSGMPAVADGENRCSGVLATKVTATEAGQSTVTQKRRGGKRRNGRSKKTANQQTLVR